MTNETGWFSDVDTDQPVGAWEWQPCLQLPGWCPSMPVWFATKADCDQFIREDIIGMGWYPGEPSS
jgi:hypothetical protein